MSTVQVDHIGQVYPPKSKLAATRQHSRQTYLSGYKVEVVPKSNLLKLATSQVAHQMHMPKMAIRWHHYHNKAMVILKILGYLPPPLLWGHIDLTYGFADGRNFFVSLKYSPKTTSTGDRPDYQQSNLQGTYRMNLPANLSPSRNMKVAISEYFRNQ